MTKSVELSSFERICRISSIEIIENYFPRPVHKALAIGKDATLNIFSYLDSTTLASKIPLVCRQFRIISCQNEAWNGRLVGIPRKILTMSVTNKEKYKIYHYNRKKEVIDFVLTHRRVKVPLYLNYSENFARKQKLVWTTFFNDQLIRALQTNAPIPRKIDKIVRYLNYFPTPENYDHFSFFYDFVTLGHLFDPKLRAECIEITLKLGRNANQPLGFPNLNKRYRMDFPDENPNRYREATLLHRIACDALYEPCYVQTLKTCLEYGANVNAIDQERLTPLQYTQRHARAVFQQYQQSLVAFQCEKQKMIRSFQTVIRLLKDPKIRGIAVSPIRTVYYQTQWGDTLPATTYM